MQPGTDLGFPAFEAELEDFEVKKLKTFDRHARITFGGTVINKPLIYKGIAYFGSCDHYVYAVDAETGKEVWRFKTGGIIFETSIILRKETLYIGSYDGYIYSLSLDGKLKWKFRTGGEIVCSACADNNFVYSGSRDGYVYCLNADSGREVWKFKTGGEIDSTPTVKENGLFVGSFDGNLYCLDKKTGKEIWRFKAGEEIYNVNPFPFYKNMLFFSSFDNNCYCVDISNGKEIWRFRTGNFGNSASPVIHEDVLYVPSRDGILYALTLEGKLIWRFTTRENVGPPLIHGDKIYAGSCNNTFYCLDMNGNEIWRFTSTDYLWSKPTIWKNRVYIGAWDCHLYCLDKDTGKKIFAFPTSTMVKSKVPPFQEMWGMEIKKGDESEETEEEGKYELNVSVGLKDEYETESEYHVKVEYQQSMKY